MDSFASKNAMPLPVLRILRRRLSTEHHTHTCKVYPELDGIGTRASGTATCKRLRRVSPLSMHVRKLYVMAGSPGIRIPPGSCECSTISKVISMFIYPDERAAISTHRLTHIGASNRAG